MPSPKELAKALAYRGEIRNTPQNSFLGGVANFLAPVSEFADQYKISDRIPFLGGMSAADLTGLKGTESLVRDMSYGKFPISGASLQTAKVDPRVLDLAGVSGAMIPVGKALGKAALREGARQIETGTGVLGRNVIDPRQQIITYHGSPHTFPPTANNPLGEFDSAKMGTGEGAQVYGEGHYTAEARKGAESYQNAGIGGIDWENAKYGNKKIQTLYDNAAKAQDRAHRLKDQGAIGKANAELAYWESMMTGTHPNIVKQNALDPESGWDELANFAKKIDDSKFKNINYPETSLYKVDIPDEHVAKMLDYDKPINEQSPYILEALGRAGINNESSALAGPMARGQERHLAKHGITGIRYLDAASRDAGKGTSNFVVFDPKHMNILERNGVGGAMMHRPTGLLGHPKLNVLPNERVALVEGNSNLRVEHKPDGTFTISHSPAWGETSKPFTLNGDSVDDLISTAESRLKRSEVAMTAAAKSKHSKTVGGMLEMKHGDNFEYAKSARSDSQYITHTPTGAKIRISDHKLPDVYESPNFEVSGALSKKEQAQSISKFLDDYATQRAKDDASIDVGGAMMQRPKTEFEILHDTAQRNAALPVEQGGLGLPANNTYIDRANAPGMFPTDAYHATNVEFDSFDPSKTKFVNGVFTSTDPSGASAYVEAKNAGLPTKHEGGFVMPLRINNEKSVTPEYFNLNNIRSGLAEGNNVVGGDVVVIPDAKNIRSRFAAFDPMRRHEADILAGVGVGGMLDPQAIAEALRQQDRK